MYKKITGKCPTQRQAFDQHLEKNREVLDRIQGNVSFL